MGAVFGRGVGQRKRWRACSVVRSLAEGLANAGSAWAGRNSRAACRGVELGHEFTVGGAGGGESYRDMPVTLARFGLHYPGDSARPRRLPPQRTLVRSDPDGVDRGDVGFEPKARHLRPQHAAVAVGKTESTDNG